MDQQDGRPNDTREFLAQWNAATEEHLTVKLSGILHRLGGYHPELAGTESSSEPYEAIAPYVLRALQVAAHPDSTIHDAIDFLEAHCR